jgi:hypothetical protein
MSPLRVALAAMLLFAGLSTSAPTTAPVSADDTWTITFSNFTSSGSTTLCGFAPESVTFGPDQLNQCTPLGDTFTRYQNTFVGSSSSIRQNCVFFFSGGICEGSATVVEVADAIFGGHGCRGTVDSFDSILYSDNCPTGTGG